MLGKLHRDKSLCNTKALFSLALPPPFFFSFPLTAPPTINKNCVCAYLGYFGGGPVGQGYGHLPCD